MVRIRRTALEYIFGNPSQEKILYLLTVSNGNWLNPNDISFVIGIDHKTVKMILSRLSNIVKEIQVRKIDRQTFFRIEPECDLLRALEQMFAILDKERIINYKKNSYWLVRKGNSKLFVRCFRSQKHEIALLVRESAKQTLKKYTLRTDKINLKIRRRHNRDFAYEKGYLNDYPALRLSKVFGTNLLNW